MITRKYGLSHHNLVNLSSSCKNFILKGDTDFITYLCEGSNHVPQQLWSPRSCTSWKSIWKLFCPIIHKTQGFPNKTLGFQLQNPGFCHKTLGFASKTLGFDTKPRVLWTKPRVFTTKPWVLFCYVYMFQNPGFHHKTLGFTLKYKIFCPKYNLTKIHSF